MLSRDPPCLLALPRELLDCIFDQCHSAGSFAGKPVPGLQELHVYNALSARDAADAFRVASFLDTLLPRLDAERCSVRFDLSHPHPSAHRGAGWSDVMKGLRSL